MGDPWCNWHMPEKASGSEAVAVAQWPGQQHPLCPIASVVVAEPHPVEPKLLVGSEGAIIIFIVTEALEYTIRGGLAVVAVS